MIQWAGSLERFARWCFDQDLPSPFRATEHTLYKYLCDLRATGAKPTSAIISLRLLINIWVVVKIMVPFLDPYFNNTAPNI